MAYICMALLCWAGSLQAQSLALYEVPTSGGVFEIEVVAELGDERASGISFFVAFAEGAFEVVEPERPFRQGPLLAPAMEFANQVMPRAEAIAAPEGMVLLPYAAVRGPGAERGRTGRGVVARFALRPLLASVSEVRLISTPVYEAKLVLDEGVGERAFQTLGAIELGGALLEREKPADGGRRSWGGIKAVILTD